jgi:outer membrane lipopolysaccharide assembly protein LptE/RlpB
MWWSERWASVLRLAALLAVSLLAACGFRLQGAGGYPDSMASTYIDAQDHYTLFYRDLRVALEQGGVTLVASPVAADTIFRIERDYTGQKVLTVSTRNVPTEYDVFYTVSYSVWMAGKEIKPSHTLTLTQDYTYDETLVLGKKREEEALREAIVTDLVRQVSYELSRLQ